MSETAFALPSLEPILGVAIALNLAFLNLNKFQYITRVKEKLESKLDALDERVKISVRGTKWYCQLDDLAKVNVIDLEWPTFTRRLWIKAPSTWGFLYNFLFYWRVGRVLSMAATAYALLLLIIGVGHDSGAVSLMTRYFSDTIGKHFFWSTLSTIWPIIVVVAGEYVCLSAARFVDYQTNNLKDQAFAGVGQSLDAIQGDVLAATGTTEAQPQ